MFPRIKKNVKKSGKYEYLVLSQSVRDQKGRSTTKDVANLGNVSNFDKKTVRDLIDGLIRLFEIGEYALADQVEILQSLEHGNIILWRYLWNRLNLSKIISDNVIRQDRRITIDVCKYIEIMAVNRCINPLSKLAASRWMDITCYSVMKGYSPLPRDVEYFYRSMDYLLKAKDDIENELFNQLRNLFTVNVNLTFYDITSTFFHTDSCPLSKNGLSRDKRPDKKQIVIGVVTSYEGYPLKHFVFEGNTKDEKTVGKVVQSLKKDFHIEETIFVGDRGMITRLNLDRIEAEEFDYIMAVKHRQDEMMPMLLEDPELFSEDQEKWKDLKLTDRRISIKSFLIWKTAKILELSQTEKNSRTWQDFKRFINETVCDTPVDNLRVKEILNSLGFTDASLSRKVKALLKKYHGRCDETVRTVCALNEKRARLSEKQRHDKLLSLSKKLDELLAASQKDKREQKMETVFEGYNRRYRKFFKWKRKGNKGIPTGYKLDEKLIAAEKKYDGVFIMTTTRQDLSPGKIVDTYKRLQEVELLFDDLKHFVDIHPVRHRLEPRVRSHVFICILSLLLKRIYEIDCLGNKSVTESLETVAQSKLVNYKVKLSEKSSATRTFWKVTSTTEKQRRCFAQAGIKNPGSLQEFMWWRK